MTNPRTILATSALPYANGPLHLGHMVEHIQTDIWARSQRLAGHDCITVCGDDAHGTPIMLKAENLGITAEALIKEIQQSHMRDFTDFAIHYDSYHTTHSSENQQLSSDIYKRLKARGDIVTRTIRQAFDPIKNIFLPDRYVKGECPRCGTADQYGDNCEACGATYIPTDLKNSVSVLSGATPIQKESEHFFFDLPKYSEFLKQYLNSGHVQEQVARKLSEWFEHGLEQWDISRDAPYFGFQIPGTEDKYFYVWLDAPIGYMASFKKLCNEKGLDFNAYWGPDSTVELHHFVGKDIIYFHALFWPAILHSANFRLPTTIHTHGFLTVNGLKMSKSRGTFINARSFLNHFPAETLRYYFAAKLSSRLDDLDLNFEDFVARVNSDLVGKFINIASRCSGFIHKFSGGRLSKQLDAPELYQSFVQMGDSILSAFDTCETSRAIREIMDLADKANQYIDENKPWTLAKDSQNAEKVASICTMGLNLFRILMIYLKPILPLTAQRIESFLKVPALTWSQRDEPLLSHDIAAFEPMIQRITMQQVENLLEEEKSKSTPASSNTHS